MKHNWSQPIRADERLARGGQHVAVVAPVFGPLLFGGRPAGMTARFFGDGTAGIGDNASGNCVVAVQEF